MDAVIVEVAKQGPLGAVLAVLLWIHARHVGRLVDAVENIGTAVKDAVEKAVKS